MFDYKESAFNYKDNKQDIFNKKKIFINKIRRKLYLAEKSG